MELFSSGGLRIFSATSALDTLAVYCFQMKQLCREIASVINDIVRTHNPRTVYDSTLSPRCDGEGLSVFLFT